MKIIMITTLTITNAKFIIIYNRPHLTLIISLFLTKLKIPMRDTK